jgi:hypothetical protein
MYVYTCIYTYIYMYIHMYFDNNYDVNINYINNDTVNLIRTVLLIMLLIKI